MAKSRFPGKALKLNCRKRVKFRFGSESNGDEERIIQIKSGLVLFSQLFGDSDEEEDFDGFGSSVSLSTNLGRPRRSKRENGNIKQVKNRVNCDVGSNYQDLNKEINANISQESPPPNLPLPPPPPPASPSCPRLVNGLNGEVAAQKAVILVQAKDSKLEPGKKENLTSVENLKNSKKSVKDSTERTSRKFVLPMVSARSSRIIKPNKRLFSDFTSLCSTNQVDSKPSVAEEATEAVADSSQKSNNKVKHVEAEFERQHDEENNDPVCRSIMFYTDSITEEFKGQVGRPPKRLLRKGEVQPKEELGASLASGLSPSKDAKEDKVKEKIEKLLRSPWDDRIKQNSKLSGKDKTSIAGSSTISKSILRKARLNLNKRTLQKIRSPASVQCLVPLSEEETAESKCGLCRGNSCNTICRYGVSCCEACHHSISNFTDGLPSNLECLGGQGECQLVGLSLAERCMGCWLGRILVSCAMPSLLHDRLRKCLPSCLKDKVPTSLGRSFNVNALQPEDVPSVTAYLGESRMGGFGSLVDLPGGWKRKGGPEVVVISPSGEKFRSILKLEEYLKRQGINAQASVLFGTLNSNATSICDSSKPAPKGHHGSSLPNKVNNVVVTTLPGGWTRRIKWRNTGDRFDTYVCSPDGRTFRSRQELSAFFQHIGKVDDIYKYFPVKSSAEPCTNSSENSEASSREPVSSSEVSADEKSLHGSDSEEAHQQELEDPTLSRQRLNEDTGAQLMTSAPPHTNDTQYQKEALIISSFSEPCELVQEVQQLDRRILHSLQSEMSKAEPSHLSEDRSEDTTSPNSSDDSDSREDIGGVNLNVFSRMNDGCNADSRQAMNYGQPYNFAKEEKIVLKIKRKSLRPSDTEGSSKDPSLVKRKKRKKKKKRKHERHLIDAEFPRENAFLCPKPSLASSLLVCDVDKITTQVRDLPHVPTSSNEASDSLLFGSGLTVAGLPCHPNDTWRTLVVPGPAGTHDESKNLSPKSLSVPVPDPHLTTTTQETGIHTMPPIITPEDASPQLSMMTDAVKKVQRKVKRMSVFTKQPLTCGWTRKVKWNDVGQGKVAFLTSPDGQKIVSSIELLAYFKKAGRTMLDLEYYFPKNLVRDPPKEGLPPLNGLSSEAALNRLSPTLSIKEKIEERRRERKAIYNMSKYKMAKRSLKTPIVRRVLSHDKQDSISFPGLEPDSGSLVPVGSLPHGGEAGPRVKHVCRSQAQVLGMPRAVFPSPDSPDKRPFKKTTIARRKSKLLNVVAPPGKRILKKTVWCNKCAGCITPNCRICMNCRDMKKYGGPGTKKKPCVKRKCFNPTKAFKAVLREAAPKSTPAIELPSADLETNVKHVKVPETSMSPLSLVDESQQPDVLNSTPECVDLVPVLPQPPLEPDSDPVCTLSDLEAYPQGRQKTPDIDENESSLNSLEKSIFIPRMMRPSYEAKDKGDIREGKECVPGTRVNIDYWQAYDAEEMLTSGFPIITSVPLQIDSVCFRCGSAGLEQLLFCIWCCEGVHPFCLEEGEGPENDEEEVLWVCKKCALCHVCGGSGHYDLLQCSGCKRHYHLECLGPSSHISCQPQQEGVWMPECLRLLSLSWPQQTPIVDASQLCGGPGGAEEEEVERVVLLEELERLQPYPYRRSTSPRWEVCPLPTSTQRPPPATDPLPLFGSTTGPDGRKLLVESVRIEDTFADLEEEEHICLEDAFDCLDEDGAPQLPWSSREDELIHFIRDWDPTEREEDSRKLFCLKDDEYLALKYKKILPFEQSPVETSLLHILRVLHCDLFEFLGYATWAEMYERTLVPEPLPPTSCVPLSDATLLKSAEKLDVEKEMQLRRAEVQQVMRELQDLRIQEEKRVKEIEREKSRKKRLETGFERDRWIRGRRKLKYRRRHNLYYPVLREAGMQQAFVEYECDAHLGEGASSRRWQPQSWAEFDALFDAAQAALNPSAAKERHPLFSKGKTDLPGASPTGILKRKRGRPRTRDLPGQRKLKRPRISNCSVKVTRLELRKWKGGRPPLSLKSRSPLKKKKQQPLSLNSPVKRPVATMPKDLPSDNQDQLLRDAIQDDPIDNATSFAYIREVKKAIPRTLTPVSTTPSPLSSPTPSDLPENMWSSMQWKKLVFPISDLPPPSTLEEEPRLTSPFADKGPAAEQNSNPADDLLQVINKHHGNQEAIPKCNTHSKEERSSSRLRKSSYGRASELASLRKALLDTI